MQSLERLRKLSLALEIPGSMMEQDTLAATLTKVPGATEIPTVVAAASLMGGRLDNCLDRIDRVAAQNSVQTGTDRMRSLTNDNLWHDYRNSWEVLIRELNNIDPQQKERIIHNGVVFFRNTLDIELYAISIDSKEWDLDKALDYRKAICLTWAEFFASLSPQSNLRLERLDSPVPKDMLQKHREILDQYKEVRSLYYGAVSYQMVCDWIGRKLNRAYFIPGLGSVGSEEIDEGEAKKIIADSIQTAQQEGGMNSFEALTCSNLLPILRRFLNWNLVRKGILSEEGVKNAGTDFTN